MLDADVVVAEWSAILRTVRNALLAVPARLRVRLPHLTAGDIRVIDEEIRNALAALGEDRPYPDTVPVEASQ